ncbi:helix-turn-helix domain-containing protein [Streptomyces sp. NPDC059909]|uniref:helix-turn-helix domain-containing protein n=1 Tax=Streptomyces sp. NPDC059909 TaxID=3346998 RepID=UPI00365607A1
MTVVKHGAWDAELRRDAGLLGAREHLLARIRRVKEDSGLSYGRLAEKTHYSRSSWERFLNGKQWPTRIAVEQLARAAGEDPEALVRLWEHAEELGREGRRSKAHTGGEESAAGGEREDTGAVAGVVTVVASEVAAAGTEAPQRAEAAAPESKAGAGAVVAARAEAAAGTGAMDSRPASRWDPRLTRARPLAHMVVGAAIGALVMGSVMGMNPASGTPQQGSGQRASGTVAQARSEGAAPTAAEPSEAPGCRGDTCLGREPQAKNCQWDATTVRETWLHGLKIQLRHSAACQAVWGRLENGTVGDRVIITDALGRSEESSIRVGGDTYTRMLSVAVNPYTAVTICGVIPRQHEQECDPEKAPQP